MAYIPKTTGQYVKFIRGTPTAWSNFDSKDENTLYFISETNATQGKLYLGSKLISDGTVKIVNSLSELDGVNINGTISDKSLLVYDAESGKWINQSVGTVLSALVDIMKGATAEADGDSGLVPKPKMGQQGLYLKGDGTWASPTAELETLVNTKFSNLYGGDANGTASISYIAGQAVAEIVAGAPEQLDTLQEIAKWITDHDAAINVAEVTNSVAKLNNTVYGTAEEKDEEGNVTKEATAGLVAVVSTLNTTVSGLQTSVSNLDSNYTALSGRTDTLENSYSNLNTKVTTIEEKLIWSELVEEIEITT